jgi:hypothetical protein
MLRRRGRDTWSFSLVAASTRIIASTARLPRVVFGRADADHRHAPSGMTGRFAAALKSLEMSNKSELTPSQ